MKLHLPSMIILLSSAATPAHATITQVIGGPGGSQFTIQCPAGQAVVGFHASAGAWVDGVAPLCAAPGGQGEQTGWAGGNRGSPQEIYCPTGKFVGGIYMTFTRGNDLPRQYVNTIGMWCGQAASDLHSRCITSGDSIGDDYSMYQSCNFRPLEGHSPIGIGWVGSDLIEADTLACPDEEVLTGITGRHGSYVDALGAVCGPRPSLHLDRSAIVSGLSPSHQAAPIRKIDRIGASVIPGAASVIPPDPVSPVADPGEPPRTDIPPDPIKPPLGRINKAAVIPPDPIKPRLNMAVPISQVLKTLDRCKAGYVWREAASTDHVCVTPEARSMASLENSAAESRRDPAGAYGPNTCVSGYVWREAFNGDMACVTPERRTAVKEENRQANARSQ